MVDNCSRTARLGTRRWGPRFQAAYEQIVLPRLDEPADSTRLKGFLDNPVHDALATAAELRPSVDISV
jgi:ketol-acid reductoisomerase